MEAEFREIFEMGCEKGVLAIVDEARWQWRRDPGRVTAFVEDIVRPAGPLRPGHGHLPRSPGMLDRGHAVLSCRRTALLAQAQEPGTPDGGGGRRQSRASG